MTTPKPPAIRLNDLGLPEGYPFQPQWEVTPRQVRQMLNEGVPCALIDCRTPREYSLVHIPDGVLVPLQELSVRTQELEDLAQDSKLVIYCHHGARSMQMATVLRHQEIRDVYSMAGGIDLWSIDIDPSLPRY